MFDSQDKIEDLGNDAAGQLMKEMHKIPTWTKAKRALYNSLVELLESQKHIYFRGHVDKYHLSVIGDSCFYNVPDSRRGHLSIYRGKTIRIICLGTGQYDRLYLATESVPN
jgi:hypothetical protein